MGRRILRRSDPVLIRERWHRGRRRGDVFVATGKRTDPFTVLSDVSRVLAASREYETTLAAVAGLALPYLGSWCALDICEEGGVMRRLAVIHPDPSKQALARELEGGWPPERGNPPGFPVVMRSRRTLVISRVDDDLLVRVARTEDLRVLRALGIGSLITVPLVARDAVLGVITFVSATTGHQYDAGDIALAEHLAALAALALDNARLQRAALGRVQAEAANDAKSQFLATMSHEIRTPINAMLGYAELLELGIGGSVNPQQRDFLARLRLSGTHLVGLVTDVLDLAKLEAGQLHVAREPAMAAAAVATALSLTFPAAEAKGIRLADSHADEPAGSCAFVGDEHRVRQVLVNLLANAVKFTPRGGTVIVSCGTIADSPPAASLAGGGPWAFIRIADTGRGIPPSEHAAVFEPFVQGAGGLTRTETGTGLGLTISRRLARLMGGDLTLSSALGEGATFTLWLPAPTGAAGALGESADTRISRALGAGGRYRAYGLAEIGMHVRRHVEDVLVSVAARLRADPALPREVTNLRRSELEDHQLAFLTDVVQSLVVIDETGGVDSALYRDGSEIQRVVSALHGRMRHSQGWTEAQVEREAAIMAEEVEALIHRYVPEGVGDVTAAVDVLRHLVEQSRVASAQGYRQAAQGGGA